MLIRLYTFTKRHNSTARPDNAPYHELEVHMKRNTSINAPIFLLDFNGVLPDYNYLVIPSLRLYYYIDDIVVGNNDVMEFVCKIDALASARPYIKSATAFVKYSSSNYDPYIKDERIQPTSDIETLVKYNSFSGEIARPSNTGTYCYLFTTVNSNGVSSYVVSWNTLKYIGQEIIDHADDIIGNIKQYFTSAKDSILKVQCIPWKLSALQSSGIVDSNPSYIEIGSHHTLCEGYLVDSAGVLISEDFIDIPARPDDFTRIEPYCEGKMHLPLLGDVDLSLSEVQDVNRLYFTYISNIFSGDTTCIIYKGSSNIDEAKIITTMSGNVNCELPMGYISQLNPTGSLTGIGGVGTAIAAAVTGGSGAVVLGGIGAAVASFGSYLTKTSSSIGAYGGNVSSYDTLKLSVVVYKHGLTENPEDLRVLYGRPCGKILPLAELTGYCQTSQFELMAPFDDSIVQEVNRLMDVGVYLE